jgi:serine/threonine protein kinase
VIGSPGTILGAVLGTTIPVGLLLLLIVIIVVLVALFSRRKERNEWELDYAELEVGEQMGAGGYGIVYKGKWRGTEVAIKTMISKDITKDLERAFKEEVLVMTALRHPNVVLFMGASTRAPHLCIVMEYMALGSLFDVRLLPPLAPSQQNPY